MRDKARVMVGCGAALALVMAAAGAAPVEAAQGSATGTPVVGTITTLAGGVGRPALATQIAFRGRLTCDDVQFASGHLYIGDDFGAVVRAVNTHTDALTTPAGDGGLGGFDGDSVPATGAELDHPCAATIDGAGNLVIADEANGRVRVVAARTGTFYGQHMVAGDIYTVASGGGPCIAPATPAAQGRATAGRPSRRSSARPTWRSTPSATWSSPTRTAKSVPSPTAFPRPRPL